MTREDENTLSSKTIANWFNFYRGVCEDYLVRNPIKIGVEGKIVEIYETANIMC